MQPERLPFFPEDSRRDAGGCAGCFLPNGPQKLDGSFPPVDATRIEYDETPEKSVRAVSLGKSGIDNLVWLRVGKKKKQSGRTVMSSASSGRRFLCDCSKKGRRDIEGFFLFHFCLKRILKSLFSRELLLRKRRDNVRNLGQIQIQVAAKPAGKRLQTRQILLNCLL